MIGLLVSTVCVLGSCVFTSPIAHHTGGKKRIVLLTLSVRCSISLSTREGLHKQCLMLCHSRLNCDFPKLYFFFRSLDKPQSSLEIKIVPGFARGFGCVTRTTSTVPQNRSCTRLYQLHHRAILYIQWSNQARANNGVVV